VSVREGLSLFGAGERTSAAGAGGLFARVEGVRNGRPCALEVVEVAAHGEAAMDDLTGGAAALFVEAFLDGEVRGPGVVPPEQAIGPEGFLARAQKLLPRLGPAVHEVALGSPWGGSGAVAGN
jgi:saccharopine dehydrogenase-like NADP-dependent oxidoreductase